MTRSYVPTESVCLLPLRAMHPVDGRAVPESLLASIFTEKIALLEVRPSSIPVTCISEEPDGI